jgi:dihydrofolate reductase
MAKFFKSIDAILVGRKTYEFATNQGHAMTSSKGMSVYLFSRTMTDAPKGLNVVSENAGEFVRNLKGESGKDIWLMGGGGLARSLLAEKLLDEISLNIHPVLLGSGIGLLPGTGTQFELELVECTPHKNGCVQVSYRVKN